jgi:cyclomaltodextrinase
MGSWARDAIVYHIYPLGLCGAPETNPFGSPPVARLEKLHGWLDHLQALGMTAVYLGPVFESGSHGYDTADYFTVDRRLGTNRTLADFAGELRRRGLRLLLDGVFHHVGRAFWAFRDVQNNLQRSPYADWFVELSFGGRSPLGDPFTYCEWEGHYELVKLNLGNPTVSEHLLQAVESWVREFDIDGLRLDVAYLLDSEFLHTLTSHCRTLKPDFWLMGEVIHGDYRRWAGPGLLDSVTNYECYKGLYSSHNDRNYFEIAYSLNRQFGDGGLYRDLALYAFADNHDVDRVASLLREPAHLYPLYCLLFTMPGVPSLYYGSEWGIQGRRTPGSDRALRPTLDLPQAALNAPHRDLEPAIARLARIRLGSAALRRGRYRQLHVNHEQLAFLRWWQGEAALVAVNSAGESVRLQLQIPSGIGRGAVLWKDALDPDSRFSIRGEALEVEVPPRGARILLPAADRQPSSTAAT